jgi:hypothetical protein
VEYTPKDFPKNPIPVIFYISLPKILNISKINKPHL